MSIAWARLRAACAFAVVAATVLGPGGTTAHALDAPGVGRLVADHVKPATVMQQHRPNSLDRAELEDAHQIPTKRREYTQSIQPDASAAARIRIKRVELTPHHVPQGVNHVIVPSLLVRLALFCPALQF